MRKVFKSFPNKIYFEFTPPKNSSNYSLEKLAHRRQPPLVREVAERRVKPTISLNSLLTSNIEKSTYIAFTNLTTDMTNTETTLDELITKI